MEQRTWLLNFSILAFFLGVYLTFKGIKNPSLKDETLYHPVSDPADLFDPFTWILAWLATKLPAWFWGIPPMILGICLFYLYLNP